MPTNKILILKTKFRSKELTCLKLETVLNSRFCLKELELVIGNPGEDYLDIIWT